ncbi:S9 family peptidase [Rubrolithibacter danxiaensis]|uniref:S9 family peptidase n=1 Tax=Rubrolithibacter danxiaensis TaxID=3390805 RepID=UPI003BF7833C
MQISLKRVFWIFLLFVVSACEKEHRAKKVPVEAFFKNPDRIGFRISPDGNYISFLQPDKDRLNLYVRRLDGNGLTQITQDDDKNISNYHWINNEELLYTKECTVDEDEHLFTVKRDGSNSKDITPDYKGKVKILNSNTKQNNNNILLALNKRDSSVFDVYQLNIRKKELSLVATNPGNITEWFADGEGVVRLAIASDGVNSTLLFRSNGNEQFKPVITTNFKTAIRPIGFCKHSKSCIYALSNLNRDKMALIEFDCKEGKEDKSLLSHPDVDISDAGYSYTKQKIQFASYVKWKKTLHYFDQELKIVYEELLKLLPNNEIRIIDQDAAGKKYIVRTFTDKTPGAYYLYIPSEKNLTKLSDVNPSIQPEDMCSMDQVSYRTRDGLTIKGYLTLPKGVSPSNLPVVVIPHGGPSTRDYWGFDSEVQFLANRGYAVFQMNFRGSVGFGKEFWNAGFKKWGTNMQNDITDGVKWLINTGIANPKKIAIYGSGFGGFSALHGLCFNPDLYACGASYGGLINLFTYMKDIPPYYKPYQQMYYEMVGNPEKDADYFSAVSPVFHTDKIQDPLLIAQGAKDPTANLNEINQFVKEIKKKGTPISYILKEDEGAYFKKEENRIEFYQKLEAFLSENLKGK